MATQFDELFRRERAFWQVSALQDIVDHGQEFTYSALEQALIELWTALVPGVDRSFKAFTKFLHELVPESKHSVYAMAGAVRQWADFEFTEQLNTFQGKLTRWAQKTVHDTATMFGTKAMEAAGKYAPARLDADLRFSAVNRDAMDWAENRSAALVTGIDNTMRRNISLIVANSQAGNATPAQMARDIYDFIPLLPSHTAALVKQRQVMVANKVKPQHVADILTANAHRYRKYRATNIARTETIMANNFGVDTYIKDKMSRGLLPGSAIRVWIATRDDRTCDRCAPMHGKTSPIDGTWRAPGARQGTEVVLPIPPLHPSCRCAIAVFTPELHTQAEVEQMWAPIHS
jgi:hypothetical protein